MSEFFPKFSIGLGGGYAPNQPSSTAQMPTVELPSVGDTILIAAYPYSYQVIGEGTQLPNGVDIIEVEVKALKKGKIVAE